MGDKLQRKTTCYACDAYPSAYLMLLSSTQAKLSELISITLDCARVSDSVSDDVSVFSLTSERRLGNRMTIYCGCDGF